MGEWSIYGSNGSQKATVKKLEYSGEFMGETIVNCDVYSPSPINFDVGDYLSYRGERFVIDYDATRKKQARVNTYGRGFLYEGMRFTSYIGETNKCEFLDYVLSDNLIHYSQLPEFSFFAESVDDLVDRLQANMNRYCEANGFTQANYWKLLTPNKTRSVQRLELSGYSHSSATDIWEGVFGSSTPSTTVGKTDIDVQISKIKCSDALKIAYDQFECQYIVRGRTIIIGTSGSTLATNYKYGRGNGLKTIERSVDESDALITRLRAYGNTTNMPANYYRNLNTLCYADYYETLGPYADKGADLHFHPGGNKFANNWFTEKSGADAGHYWVEVSLDEELWVTAIASTNAGNGGVGFSVVSTGMYGSNTQDMLEAFNTQLGSTGRLYFRKGVNYDNWGAGKESGSSVPASLFIDRLMLPSFPTNPNPYIDSSNIGTLGIREKSVYFDGSDPELPDIHPSLEGMTAHDIDPVHGSSSDYLDEIAADATEIGGGDITTDGQFVNMDEVPGFQVKVKDIGFDINSYLSTETATLSMKSGKCGGREFTIVKVEKAVGGGYLLTCQRTEDINLYFPYKDYPIEAGDKFVLTGIEMPDIYIQAASQRLYDAAVEYLAKHSQPQYVYAIKMDDIWMQRQADGCESITDSYYWNIKEGDIMQVQDVDLGIYEGTAQNPTPISEVIDRLTIREGYDPIPQIEVVLRKEKPQGTIGILQNRIRQLEAQNAEQVKTINRQNDYITLILGDRIKDIENQADHQQISWFGTNTPNVDPDNPAYPIDQWTDDWSNHIGDMYYDKDGIAPDNTPIGYVFEKNNNSYQWTVITDPHTLQALAIASEDKDTIDGKRRVFVITAGSVPLPPYEVGDLWVNAIYPSNNTVTDEAQHRYYNDVLKCITDREKDYSAAANVRINDWSLASKYTDDSKLNTFLNGYQGTLTDIQTQVDQKAETWYQANDPSTGWDSDEKEMHEGDIWYNTAPDSNGNCHTYIYRKNGNNYEWQEINGVPEDLFDTIDGKASIYVTWGAWGNDLQVKDLFIPSANTTQGGVTYYANKVYRCTNSTTPTFQEIDYTDDAALNAFLNGYTGTLTGIRTDISNAQTTANNANTAAAAAQATADALDYLKQAYSADNTLIDHGLILSTIVALRDSNNNVWSGISGAYDSTKLGNGIAAWYGGGMIDKEAYQTPPSNSAKSLFRFDGTGYLANGNIKWNSDGSGSVAGGNLAWNAQGQITTIAGQNISATTSITIGTGTGNNVLTQATADGRYVRIDFFNQLFAAFSVANPTSSTQPINPATWTSQTIVNNIKAKVGLWTEQFLSTLGLNSQGGGGGGVKLSAVWQSLMNNDDDFANNKINIAHIPDLSTLSWTYGSVANASNNSYNGKAQKSFIIPKTLDHIADGTNRKLPVVAYTNKRFTLNGDDLVTASTIVADGGGIKTIKINGTTQTVTNNSVNLPAYPNISDLAKKDGSNATGTWGISISGNAATATKSTETTRLVAGQILTENTVGDANTMTIDNGSTEYGIITNYHSNPKWSNMPSNYGRTNSYGGVVELKGKDTSLKMQFAWSATHNEETSPTKGLWFRARANKGYVSSDWKQVAFATDLDAYLKLVGNTSSTPMTGNVFFNNNIGLYWKNKPATGETAVSIPVVILNSSNNLHIGTNSQSYPSFNTYLSGNNVYIRGGVSGKSAINCLSIVTSLDSSENVIATVTANQGLVIPSAKTLKIGNAVLSWDSINNCLKVSDGTANDTTKIGFYATGTVSALGANTSGGGGTGIEMPQVWEALAQAGNNEPINYTHIQSALTNNGYMHSFSKTNPTGANVVTDVSYNSGTGTLSVTRGSLAMNALAPRDIPTTLATFYDGDNLIYTRAGGSNSVADKPSGVDAFGVITMRTASGYYGQILYGANGSIYCRTDTTANIAGKDWLRLLSSSNYSSYTYDKNATYNKKLVLASSATADEQTATFRELVAADIPSLPASKIGSGTLNAARLPDLSGTYLPLNGSSKMTGSLKTVRKNGSWIIGKTEAAIMYNGGTPLADASTSEWLFNMVSSSGNTIAFGGLKDTIGFYGWLSDRTANGTDWSTSFNTGSGVLTISSLGSGSNLVLSKSSTTSEDYPAQITFNPIDSTTGYQTGVAQCYIRAYNDHSSPSGTTATNGANMVIRSGGNIFIGGGEGTQNHYNEIKEAATNLTKEYTFITSDNNIYLQSFTSTDGIAGRKGFVVTQNGNLIPCLVDAYNASATNSIGSSAYPFYALYASNSVKIGNCTISWDSTNNLLKFSTGIYSEGTVSALGANNNSSGGGGADINDVWDSLTNSTGTSYSSTTKIHSDHIDIKIGGDGNAVTGVTTSGTSITLNKGTKFLPLTAGSGNSLSGHLYISSGYGVYLNSSDALSRSSNTLQLNYGLRSTSGASTHIYGGTNGSISALIGTSAKLSIYSSQIQFSGLTFKDSISADTSGSYILTTNGAGSGEVKYITKDNLKTALGVVEPVTALGTSGNYLTWTKGNDTNNITIPYATKATNDESGYSLKKYKHWAAAFTNDGTKGWYTVLSYTHNYYYKSAILHITTRRNTAILLVELYNLNTPRITCLGYYGDAASADSGGFTGKLRIIKTLYSTTSNKYNAIVQAEFYNASSSSTTTYRYCGLYGEYQSGYWSLPNTDSLVKDTTYADDDADILGSWTFTINTMTSNSTYPLVNATYSLGTTAMSWLGVYGRYLRATVTNGSNNYYASIVAASSFAANRTYTLPYKSANDTFAMLSDLATTEAAANDDMYILGVTASAPNAIKRNPNAFMTGSGNLTVNGNITAAGEITASSDERLKTINGGTNLTIKDIASAPSIRFTWNDKRDEKVHIGSIAQYWEKALPEAVSYDGNGIMSLNYGALALVSAITIARRLMKHEDEITKLKKRVAKLEKELKERRAA